ncbi:MAG: hypothetical protein AAFN93_05495 [Bacteroidota bacterium]
MRILLAAFLLMMAGMFTSCDEDPVLRTGDDDKPVTSNGNG